MYNPVDDLDRLVDHLRRPVRMDPGLDTRVMQQVAELAPPRRTSRLLAGLAIAAGVIAIAVFASRQASVPGRYQFVLVVPQASTVSLVGDFNDWDPRRTPMQLVRGDGGTWTAVVPLTPGRYRYGFLVNGSRWLADRAAPAALDDEFGAPSSVITVGGS